MSEVKTFDLVGQMMAFENGDLGGPATLELFADLIKSGKAWQLQGSVYARPARSLIENGWITKEGEIVRGGPKESGDD